MYVYLTVFTNGTQFYSQPKLLTNLHTGSLYYRFSGFVNKLFNSLCEFLTHKRYATNYKTLVSEREPSSVRRLGSNCWVCVSHRRA